MGKRDRDRVAKALFEHLAAVPPPENLDLKPLKGHEPWMRLRVGDWRIIYRPLTDAELKKIAEHGELEGEEGFLVDRIVNRKDLEKVVKALSRP